jgi:uncharacterized membrane protein YdjX (TVP38/TMEM64 family)
VRATALAHRYTTPARWMAVLMVVVALLVLIAALPVGRAIELLKLWVDGFGAWAPLVFGALYVVATVLLFPASALTLAAGALFGIAGGVLTTSLAATTTAAIAFLIARYAARDRVREICQRHPKMAAVDRAVEEGGWKIVALLRLSPALPFNLQNYAYGLTGLRFVPYVLASWVFMLPGSLLYVYLGYLGRVGLSEAAGGTSTSALTWTARVVGLVATVAVTVYVARLARRKLETDTAIAESQPRAESEAEAEAKAERRGWPWRTTLVFGLAAACLALSIGVHFGCLGVRDAFTRLLGPPPVTMQEAYADAPDGETFDHAAFDELLRRYVEDDGLVDYDGLAGDRERLQGYLDSLAQAPFDALGRDEKLALLINAYNAFTLELILEWRPLASIRDIPGDARWDGRRWNVGGALLTLNELEHEQIRPRFVEPRIHFALVCAALGCPVLRREAYVGGRLDAQLEAAARDTHRSPRWFDFDPESGTVALTRLYEWYRGDFEQVAGSVLAYAAQWSEPLGEALGRGERLDVVWLDYDWRLNSSDNRELLPSR